MASRSSTISPSSLPSRSGPDPRQTARPNRGTNIASTGPVHLTDPPRLSGIGGRSLHAQRPLSLLGLVDVYRRSLIVSILLFVAAGLALGYLSPVTYTAQAQMLAAGTSVDAAAVPSFTQAGQSLAQTYSRVFSGDSVQQALLKKGYDPSTETVTASPVAATSVVLIEATAPAPAVAARLANNAVAALQTTVSSLLDNSRAVERTRSQMEDALVQVAEANAAIKSLDRRKADQNSASYGQASADLSTAQANADALRSLLTEQISGSVAANGIAPLTSGGVTGSNSRQRFQLWGAVGLVTGISVWLVIALIRSARLQRGQSSQRSARS